MGKEKKEESRAEPEAPREQAEMGVELWPSPRKEMAPEAWQLLWLIPYGGPGEEGRGVVLCHVVCSRAYQGLQRLSFK